VTQADLDTILRAISGQFQTGTRFIVAIAGPPASGKSTFAEMLQQALNAQRAGQSEILPMDGFHFDNAVLSSRGQLAQKGAPQTFDIDSFAATLSRIRSAEKDVVVPVFDRDLDLARAGGRVIGATVDVIIVEGNYLMLNRPEWLQLATNYDLTIGLDVAQDVLEHRLIQRWVDQGMALPEAENRARGNDMANAATVIRESLPADITIAPMTKTHKGGATCQM
jgi:pantothenate kinase